MLLELTAVFRKAPEGGYVAFVEELPGANTEAPLSMRLARISAKRLSWYWRRIANCPSRSWQGPT